MSLVVAAIHDGDQITMVSDTKVTWEDANRTRHTYSEALPKIVLLRQDLAVGVTGEDPHQVIEELVALRDEPIASVLDFLSARPSARCVVASLGPGQLWSTASGLIEHRTLLRRAWAGDSAANNLFRHREADWPEGVDLPFRLLSSMQWLTSFNPVATVGGYTLRVGSSAPGFHFVADRAWVGPWLLEATASSSAHGVSFSATVPEGGDSSTHEVLILPGVDETFGALGLLVPEAHTGLLFTHEQPWKAVQVEAGSAAEFQNAAERLHGQRLLPLA